jgi:four helix bundle protein
MSRDHHKLRAFHLADALIVDIYKETEAFPVSERYGLQSQIRRAAVSMAANIVEGSARRSIREYVHFLNVATGSTFETRYLLSLSTRLGLVPGIRASALIDRCTDLAKTLVSLVKALERLDLARS